MGSFRVSLCLFLRRVYRTNGTRCFDKGRIVKEGPDISRVAALIGDPARANMLTALMDGRALTASELAAEAGVTAQTASSHLAQLAEGGLVTPRKQGRHKYFALSQSDVADVLEGLMGLSAQVAPRVRTGPKDDALREARVCYNHLAGRRGIQMFDAMTAHGFLEGAGDHVALTEAGARFVTDFGVDLTAIEVRRRARCQACLDWSERRSHLGGPVGRALFAQMAEKGWLRRDGASRVVVFTQAGRAAFDQVFAQTREAGPA